MKELDKSKIYDLRFLTCEQRSCLSKELNNCYLRDIYWKTISYSNYYGYWIEGNDIHNKRRLVNALELFRDMKEITQEQKEQLINLNDSRVNEILGVKKLEVGKWYCFTKNEKVIFFIKNIDDSIVSAYGINYKNDWDNTKSWFNIKDYEDLSEFRKATHEEVENALIKEAKRRGFKGGFNYDNVYNEFWCNSEMIFSKGNWDKPKPDKQEIINQINELLKQL